MIEPGEQDLVAQVLSWVKQNNRSPEETDGEIDKDTDLLAAGVLDSIAFIELITFIESETGYQIDIAEADPEDFATVAGLCRYAIKTGS